MRLKRLLAPLLIGIAVPVFTFVLLRGRESASPGPDESELLLYRAAAQATMHQIPAAEATFRSIDASKVDRRKYEALRAALAERKSGTVPFVFDRLGGVIDTHPDFASMIDTIRAQRIGDNATLETTLDPFVQKAALEALGKYRGAFVVIDPRTNEILAMANIGTMYEAGSVIKVLTGLDALGNGVNVDSMFPYVCNGELMIEGRRFGDWAPQGHGKLDSIDDALAVSCNVFFADLGLRLGRDRLQRFLNAAGFDGQANLGIFQVPLGRIVGPVSDNFETALLAIGLKHEEINAIHLAMLASMMANRGELITPRLLRQRRSILGEVVAVPPQQGRTRIATVGAANRMIRAMEAVTTAPHGTGRRAPVEGLSLAMKTGTAGERKSGLEALIMAFAPVESPEIAFGVIAEDAGPAELAGAKIVHDFLERVKPRLRGGPSSSAASPARAPAPH